MCAVVVNYSVFVKELAEVPTDFSVFSLAVKPIIANFPLCARHTQKPPFSL